ncbi:tRNA1(Val) (adenine(37)-N6)-methyltransferase [Lacibacterium aquatile]|uniref:tRNA1(Val) (Adenine(37)-N6)-methyltransferase n=1 Tax=Lacibacterium aquatile TaxID=1168082 RepID=A0ABW5DUL5_9PROT
MTDTTDDIFLGGLLRVRQPAKGYRAGVDPVILAASILAPEGAHLVEMGLGVGAAALCLLARRPDLRVTGYEIDSALAALARENAVLNGFADRLTVIEGDVLVAEGRFAGGYANPPYHGVSETDASPIAWKAKATIADPEPWAKAAARLIAPRGQLTLIYRMDRLPELLTAVSGRFGALEALPLWPRPGGAAKRVILRGIKGSRAPFTLKAGLVLHRDGQGYTPEVEALLKEAAAFPGEEV